MFYLSIIDAKNEAVTSLFTRFKEEFEPISEDTNLECTCPIKVVKHRLNIFILKKKLYRSKAFFSTNPTVII